MLKESTRKDLESMLDALKHCPLNEITESVFEAWAEIVQEVLHSLPLHSQQAVETKVQPQPWPTHDLSSSHRHTRFQKLIIFFDAAATQLKYPALTIMLDKEGNRLKISRAGETSKAPGSLNITDGKEYGSNIFYGRVGRDGYAAWRAEATTSIKETVARINENPAEAGKLHGQQYGNCMFCGLELTDKRSVEKGYGPICAEHWGLPWGEAEDKKLDLEHGL